MQKPNRSARLFAICLALPLVIVPVTHGADKREIVRQARQSYYNLANAGLNEFRCQVLPDWDTTFEALKADPVGRDQVLPILRKTHFELLVGPNGASTVSHQSELAPPNEAVAERVRKAIGGMEQILTGFLQTWSQFMIHSTPLPDADGDYRFEELGNKYRVTLKEGSADAVILMGHDFEIEELKATTPEFSGNVRPKFVRIKNGMILSSYDATYKTASGTPQALAVRIEYGEVEGLSLPSKVTASMDLPAGTAEFPLTFASYQVKKR